MALYLLFLIIPGLLMSLGAEDQFAWYAATDWQAGEKDGATEKSVLIVTLTLSLVAIGWTLIRTAQKHDAWIMGKLSEEFAEDARFDKVHFTVRAGTACLKGSVTVLEDKRRQRGEPAQSHHVGSVTNDIIVETRRFRTEFYGSRAEPVRFSRQQQRADTSARACSGFRNRTSRRASAGKPVQLETDLCQTKTPAL
jgi:hypothetical protein